MIVRNVVEKGQYSCRTEVTYDSRVLFSPVSSPRLAPGLAFSRTANAVPGRCGLAGTVAFFSLWSQY